MESVLSVGANGSWYFEWFRQSVGDVTEHIGIEAYLPRPDDLPGYVTWVANTADQMIDVASGSVDLVFAGQTTEHLWAHELVGFLSEAHRVLRAGGRLSLDSPNQHVTQHLLWSHGEHTIELDEQEFSELLELAGFACSTWRGSGAALSTDSCSASRKGSTTRPCHAPARHRSGAPAGLLRLVDQRRTHRATGRSAHAPRGGGSALRPPLEHTRVTPDSSLTSTAILRFRQALAGRSARRFRSPSTLGRGRCGSASEQAAGTVSAPPRSPSSHPVISNAIGASSTSAPRRRDAGVAFRSSVPDVRSHDPARARDDRRRDDPVPARGRCRLIRARAWRADRLYPAGGRYHAPPSS